MIDNRIFLKCVYYATSYELDGDFERAVASIQYATERCVNREWSLKPSVFDLAQSSPGLYILQSMKKGCNIQS